MPRFWKTILTQGDEDSENMPNEHTEYSGEVDVPAEAIQIIDPNVVASTFPFVHSYFIHAVRLSSTLHFDQRTEDSRAVIGH